MHNNGSIQYLIDQFFLFYSCLFMFFVLHLKCECSLPLNCSTKSCLEYTLAAGLFSLAKCGIKISTGARCGTKPSTGRANYIKVMKADGEQ